MSTNWSYYSKSEKHGIIKSITFYSKFGNFIYFYKWIIKFHDNTECELNELKPSIILKMSVNDVEAINEAKKNNALLMHNDSENFKSLHIN
jgi:hypothetical protein